MNEAVSEDKACPLEVYVNGEDNLPVRREIDDSSWESSLFAGLGEKPEEEASDDEGDDQENAVHDEPPMTVNSYKEANELLDQVKCFLEAKGHIKETLTVHWISSQQCFKPSAFSN